MVITTVKNQQAAIEVIRKYSNNLDRRTLINFTRDLAKRLIERAQEEDCYTIDMLEDISNILIEE